MLVRAAALPFALLISTVVACGGEPDLSDPEEAGEALGEAFCGYLAGCCDEGVLPGGSEGACVEQLAQNFDLLIQQSESEGYTYDPRCVEAQIEVLAGASCSISGANGVSADGTCRPYCAGIAHGTKQKGQACDDARECDFGLMCIGTCVAQCGNAPGEPCGQLSDGSYAACQQSAFCDVDPTGTGAGTCVALPTRGQPCEGFACAAGLACIDGVCGDPQPDGAACQQPTACTSGYCDVSDPAAPVCGPPPGPGEACSYLCAPGSVCDGATCVPLPVEGQACPDYQCAPGLVCQDDVCTSEAELLCSAFTPD